MTVGSPIRVLVVDDSALTRRIIRDILSSDAQLSVIGEARNGREAVTLVEQLRPDIVTMDVRMPVLDGLQATEEIMAYHPTPILVLTSSLGRHDGGMTFQLLNAGALEVLEKPKDLATAQGPALQRFLIQRVKMLARVRVVTHLRGRRRARSEQIYVPTQTPLDRSKHQLVVIGASTGGPKVLYGLLRSLPSTFPAAIVIVQHIAEGFVANMVEWLNTSSALPVMLGADGMELELGKVFVAPDTHHTRIEPSWRLSLDIEPRSLQHPSIDVTLQSAADHCATHTVGVILTGMGRDGAAGLLALRKAGGLTIVQDQASSAIWGMPRAAAENGAALEIVSADDLPNRLTALTLKQRARL